MALWSLHAARSIPAIAIAGAAALGALTYSGIASLAPAVAPAPAAPRVSLLPAEIEPLTDQELAAALTRLRLDAQSLAATGFSEAQTTALVGRVRTHLTEHIQELRDADSSWAQKRRERDRLEGKIRSGTQAQGDIERLATARAELASATLARQEVLDAILSAAGSQVGGPALATLSTLRANAASWDVPVQYLAATRTEPEWMALRGALAHDRISTKLGEEPDPAVRQLLLGVQSEPAIAAATSNLSSNLPLVTAAWNSAVFR